MSKLSGCTCFHLRRAARRTSQLYDRALAPVGLSLNEYSILRRLDAAQSLGALAHTLGMDRTTLTRNLKPLLAAGWIKTQRGEDARQKWLVLSRSGRGLLVRAFPHWQAAQRQLETLFGSASTDQLHATLALLDAALDVGAAV
ncbi:MarR family winged helix-turn-helix transcriptional regulator [Xanthomonas hortorum pv. vitians]|uniref:HTH marR-type domain-containing protein n=1 Tax=Xanthomonas hortorum pv. gardneri TaxID=2754056 RepID=A0A0G8LR60_9XANT|nr:MarR family winged helix-turn-helix transcriptional regulator [Xanthomonas hortorum]MCC4624895.1 MarR family winged helix-turn-helix transcriptional regulator [Xanthomonas campestris pv. nigromaculans]APP81340.1 MarR family transcriptional regulator [Xanthomonas hortorum pv. gardneri]APP85505.1 MarR family transcriptional regulator [Xanthomonas hortorum pv. gardneri]ASW44633.1 MarR family transcriptional regulator [Xanthomonas hortorum]EGD19511.1 transcriptional regulator [Xanthomonas horto